MCLYARLPCWVFPLTATKPRTLSSLRAALTALVQLWMCLYARLPAAFCFFDTTLPHLFFRSAALLSPLTVRSLDPRNTMAFESLPFAILEMRLAFIAFIALAAFIAFIAAMASGRGQDASTRWGAEGARTLGLHRLHR